jgi:hypothetical protein
MQNHANKHIDERINMYNNNKIGWSRFIHYVTFISDKISTKSVRKPAPIFHATN